MEHDSTLVRLFFGNRSGFVGSWNDFVLLGFLALLEILDSVADDGQLHGQC